MTKVFTANFLLNPFSEIIFINRPIFCKVRIERYCGCFLTHTVYCIVGLSTLFLVEGAWAFFLAREAQWASFLLPSVLSAVVYDNAHRQNIHIF